jgi:hypothetical protein
MQSKKSYMNKKNILNEDFFTNMGRIGAIIRGLKKTKGKSQDKKVNRLKKDREAKAIMKDLNSTVADLEKYYSKLYGSKVKLDRFNTKDFS